MWCRVRTVEQEIHADVEKEPDIWNTAEMLRSFAIGQENVHKLRCELKEVVPWTDVHVSTGILAKSLSDTDEGTSQEVAEVMLS